MEKIIDAHALVPTYLLIQYGFLKTLVVIHAIAYGFCHETGKSDPNHPNSENSTAL